MKFFIADAFTDKVFGGNPAGVVILDKDADFPAKETMRLTAAEFRYSETAFIKCLDDGVFNVRYFTPADEVDLCGHATIASFHCLREAGLVKPGQTVVNETLAGRLNIVIGSDSILMDMATPTFLGKLDNPDAMKELYEIMGIDCDMNIAELEKQCAANCGDGSGLKPEIISTGLPDILMPVANREQLAAISPDFPALTELSKKYNVVGVHAYTPDGGKHRPSSSDADMNVDAYCRNFAPLYNIDEEAATGTSNGALTYCLLRNGVLTLPRSCDMLAENCEASVDCLFIQGESMERPSAIRSRTTESDGSVKIQVGGNAVILAEGTVNIK